MKRVYYIILCIALLSVYSCSKDDDLTSTDDDDNGTPNTETNDSDIDTSFTTNSKDTVFTNTVTIAYSTDGVTVNNPYQSNGVAISVDGGDVVVTSTISSTEVNYVLSGSHTNGSFKIYSDYKFGLGLNGVNLVNSDGPAINIQSGKSASIYLVGGTNNRLIDNNVYASSSEDMKATLFSEGQLVFYGNGNLKLKGYFKHAISSDDYIQIKGGNITVENSYKDGIHVNDYFVMDGGTVSITSSGDGIECEAGYITLNGGNLTINSLDDGIVSSYSGSDSGINSNITIGNISLNISTTGQKAMGVKSDKGTVNVTAGTINIKTTGAGSKAFKASGNMTVAGGNTTLVTSGNAFYDTEDVDISSSAGIKCDGNLTIEKGTLTITSSGTAGKGINVDGTLTINDGTIKVTTTGGQYKSGSDTSYGKAIKSEGNLTINGGSITVKTSGAGAEGIESKKILTINSGNIEIEAYDDCINASSQIVINGGNIYCYSSTNDGIDSNGTLTVTGGVIISSGTTSPEEGFDCDNNTFKITGGILIGTGGATSTPTSSVSTQRSVIYGGSGTANQLIHIESSSGTSVLTYKIPRSYSQMTLLFSSPDLAANTSYTIYTGGNTSGGSDFHGLYTGATYTQGTSAKTFTTSSMVTTVGNTSTGGGRP